MATVGQELAQPAGDLELADRCALGDELAARHLLARHRAAVADSGLSPDEKSLDVSGQRALAQVRNGSGPQLPFRARWLALHAQGMLPADGERRNPVWDAFCALPLAQQTALWHREVEGQGATEIAAVLGTSTDEVRRDLVAAYAAVKARIEETHSPSPATTHQLLLLQHSLRDTLAGVVLGAAAGRYLAVRPRVGRRVPLDATPSSHHRTAPYLAGLTAAVVGVAAAVSFLGPGQVGTTRAPVVQAAVPFEAPVIGDYLQALPEPAPTTGRDRAPQGGTAVPVSSAGSTAGSGGAQAGGRDSGGPKPGTSTGGGPTGGNTQQPGGPSQPGPAPADTGPGQGAQHASQQGLAHGVRDHGNGNKGGGSKAKSSSPGKSKGKVPGKSKGKARGHR